jgi:hypothetical protein
MLNTTIIREEVLEEQLSGVVNGVNTIFTANFNFDPDSVKLYLNGLRQKRGMLNDFVISGTNQITMNEAPIFGDSLIMDYIRE